MIGRSRHCVSPSVGRFRVFRHRRGDPYGRAKLASKRFAVAADTILVYGETMSDAPNAQPAALSRRSILRNLAFTAGGAAVLGSTVSGGRRARAESKMTQTAVGYQATPKDAQRCDNCTQFEPSASCKVVEGNIAPSGWCKIYVKKPA
jgi:hypothetical protein